MKKLNVIKQTVLIYLMICSVQEIKSQTNFVWGRQFGTDKEEVSLNVVADEAGNIYVAGGTQGNMSGNNYGNVDGFLTKLDTAGTILWTKQFGTKEYDGINWITIDKKNNVYLTGATGGMVGSKSYGLMNVWVVKFDSSGNMAWQQQYGTDSVDVGNGIYVNDKGEIFVSGITKGILGKSSFGKMDCFILKLNNDGKKIFVLQFGTKEDDNCNGITVDAAQTIYVCGGTFGDLLGKNEGKTDAFVGLFNADGKQLKMIQFGTDNYDMASHAVIDKDGNIYTGSSTGGDFGGKNQGEGDCLLVKFNKNGDMVWSKQFGTEKWDGILGIDMNEKLSDNIVISGCQHWPECQSFVRMFTKDGDLLWTRNSSASGKSGGTCGKGVCFDRKGNVYHTGLTGGNLFNSIMGQHDIFVVKYEPDKNWTKP
jgi:hypothetical protein